MATLKDYLTGTLSYDSSWGVWAERIDGKFELESEARFGQFMFENGGMDDSFELIGNNVFLTDSRDNYCGTDEDCEDFYKEWAEQFVEELNLGTDEDKQMSESKVRFKVWFNDGAITPSWVVNSVNDNDFDHSFTGAINADSTKDQIIQIGKKYGVKSEEIFIDY